MRICRRCGVYAPRAASLCDWCNHDLRDTADDVSHLRQRVAAARIARTCDRCGTAVPLDALPDDRSVRCGWCGAVARVEDPEWRRLLERLHAVADLVGDHPEGFEPSVVAIDEVNPFADEARRTGVVRFARDEADAVGGLPPAFRAEVAPGVPLGEDDGAPMAVEPTGRGGLRVRADGDLRRYGVPAAYVALYPQLVGVIAPDHRADTGEAQVVDDGEGGWSCPACGAALRRSDATRYRARCAACGEVVRVPAALRHHKVRDPRPDTLWVLFDGPSPERRRLERDPKAGTAPDPADRPLETMPLVAATPRGRVAQGVYVAVVPLGLLAIAGLVAHGPRVWAAVRAAAGGWFG